MSRKYLYALLACLLSLLPALSSAQSLTQCEYWLDNDFDNRKTIALSGAEDEIDTKIDVESLVSGVHEVFFRFRQSGGAWSAITSKRFTKFGLGDSKLLEYWFDGNRSNSQQLTGVTPSDDPHAIDFINRIDCTDITSGFHTLSYRVVSQDGLTASSVVTKTFYKYVGLGNVKLLEYWFDGNRGEVHRLPGVTSSEEEEALDFNNLIDCTKLPAGLHTISLRVVSQNNLIGSSVITKTFFKYVGLGSAKTLEYWFDDNREKVYKMTGVVSSAKGDTIDFIKDIDLSNLTPGHHRLYYRVASKNGQTNSAISMTPIMVKSRYDVDPANVNILGYSISIDGKEPEVREFGSPKSEIVMSHTLDARNLSTGNHTVKAKFWNSINAGVSAEQQFNVVVPEAPTLTLTAQEGDGLVNLQFESVPNDLRYRIIRVDGNGTKAKVDGKEGSTYPGTVTFVDNPTAGTYTYYVQTVYTDFDGEQHSLKSNEVSVTVAKPQTEVVATEEFGYVTGSVICDKDMPTFGLKVLFSDGVTANVKNTKFVRTRIPADTELTLTVEGDDTHDYTPVNLTVKAGANEVVLKGFLREKYQPNNLVNDLAICSSLEQTVDDGKEHHVKFTVKNLSGYNKWTGTLRVKAIERKWADKKDIDIVATSYEKKNFYIGETNKIEIAASGKKEVDICLTNLKVKEDTEFYLYLESVGKWIDRDEAEEYKPLAIANGADISENPVVKTIGVAGGESLKWDDDARQLFASIIVWVSSIVPGIAGNVGDLSAYYKDALSAAKKITGVSNDDTAIQKFFEWMAGKSVWEVINEPNLISVTSVLNDIYSNVRSYGNGTMLQKYWNDVLGASYDYGSAQLVISDLAMLAHATVGKDPIEATAASASTIYSLVYPTSSAGAVPYAAMMYSYTVVGRAMVAKILEYASIMRGRYILTRLKANKPFNGNEENRQNTAVDFKLVVKTKNLIGSSTVNFKKASASSQIKSISIKAAHKKEDEPAEFSFIPVFMEDCIMLKSDGKGITNQKHLDDQNELKELYMEINWSNGRQTLVPLNDETDGIDISFKGADAQGIDHFEEYKPLVYTITLTTTTGKDNMADEHYLGSNKNRK